MDSKERRLAAMHPALVSTYSGAAGWANLNGWQTIPGTDVTVFHETQIDLSGYAMDSLTFFPTSLGLQDPGIYIFKVGGSSIASGLQVLDIVTSVPMNIQEISDAIAVDNTGPGMLGSTREFETILFGSFRFFTENTQIPYPNYQQLERSQRFDSGEPTAADKLYCYRIVCMLTTDLDDNSVLSIPAARQLVAGVMGEETELVYMQRLKRSYELANQV